MHKGSRVNRFTGLAPCLVFYRYSHSQQNIGFCPLLSVSPPNADPLAEQHPVLFLNPEQEEGKSVASIQSHCRLGWIEVLDQRIEYLIVNLP